MPTNRPERLDPATLTEIRTLTAQIGEHNAIAKALDAERRLVLARTLYRAGVPAEVAETVQLQPDGALVYPPPPLPLEVVAALAAEKQAITSSDNGK